MPKISVIIPCYNNGLYIKETLDSVLKQSFQDFEIIIVNDGSSDSYTNELLKDLNYPKTKVIHTKNRGVSSARNTAIQSSSGEYILPLDSDDLIHESYLEKANTILDENKDIAIVYCEAEFFGDKSGKWELPPYSLREMLFRNMIFCTGLYRRADYDKTSGYDESMPLMEDQDFWLSIIELENKEVHCIPEVLFFYRIHKNGTIQSILKNKQQSYYKNYKKLFSNHKEFYSNHAELIFDEWLKEYLRFSPDKKGIAVAFMEILDQNNFLFLIIQKFIIISSWFTKQFKTKA